MLADPDDLAQVKDLKDGNWYFPKEIGNRFPHIQLDLCFVYIVIIVIALPLVNNHITPAQRKEFSPLYEAD